MSLADILKGIIPGKVKQVIEERFTSLKNFIITMCISDMRISQDKEYAPEVSSILLNGLYLEWQDDMHCSIGVKIADTVPDKVHELVEFCFHTGKQYVFG